MKSLPYRDPVPSPALMRVLGHVNRLIILPRVLRVSRLDLPAADMERLRGAVNPDTAAFVTPGHPEFFTDWMIDKEVTRRVAPRVASWAAHDVVNASPMSQRFWLANGLIANTPGGGGKNYSLQKARAGHGVLLHPEGAVNWQAERISALHPGAIDMATTLAGILEAERDPRPVFVVPMVWRLTFTTNVRKRLLNEMLRIERACGLSLWRSPNPAERLAALLSALLARRARLLCLSSIEMANALACRQYFSAQAIVLNTIREHLSRFCGPLPDDPMHAMRAIQRGLRRRANVDPDQAARGRALMMEFHRLSRIDPALYGKATLTQEQIAEILKATRAAVLTSGVGNALHNAMPRAVAPRSAHIRVADPIDIRWAVRSGATSASLVETLRRRLQDAQDNLGTELEPLVAKYRMSNPMEERQLTISYRAS